MKSLAIPAPFESAICNAQQAGTNFTYPQAAFPRGEIANGLQPHAITADDSGVRFEPNTEPHAVSGRVLTPPESFPWTCGIAW